MWKRRFRSGIALSLMLLLCLNSTVWDSKIMAAVKESSVYAVMIEQEDGQYILYEDMAERSKDKKLMISSDLLKERLPGLKVSRNKENKMGADLILLYGEQRNGYTIGQPEIQIKNGKEEVLKTAEAPYFQENTGDFMIPFRLEGLLPYVYMEEPVGALYEAYKGVILYGPSVMDMKSLPKASKVEVIKLEVPHSCLDTVVSPYSNNALSASEIKSRLNKYGSVTMQGFSMEECEEIYSREWIDATEYNKKPTAVTVDIAKQYNYNSYVSILKQLSRYEGVYLYEIGRTTKGRPMYTIVVDMKSDQPKKTLMFTGVTHSREGAGGVFLLKQFADLITAAQKNKGTMNLLKQYTYVAVPIISADVREELINGNSGFVAGGQLWKAYANGVDGNRNYPGINSGMLAKGVAYSPIVASAPGYGNFPGYSAASNSETKAMMQWLYHYIVCEQAIFLADYHQQGHLMYGGKPYDTKRREADFRNVAESICGFLNDGNASKYSWIYEGEKYGLNGMGSTLTDYAISCALGAKYSRAYRNFVIIDESTSKERTLMEYQDLDKFPGTYRMANSQFRMVTFEIASGVDKLGYSSSTRNLLKKEYQTYHFGELFYYLPSIL